MKKRKIADGFSLAEGPLYSKRHEALFFVDILGHRVHARWEDGRISSYDTGSFVSAIGLTEDEDRLLVARKDSLAYLSLSSGRTEDFLQLDVGKTMRLNDGKVGPDGSFYVGSMGIGDDRTDSGCLYRASATGYETVLSRLTIPNGMDWYDGFFYFIDTPTHTIRKYDSAYGVIDSFSFPSASPDGMTISRNGLFYVALWGDGKVAVLDFERKEILGYLPTEERNTSCPVLGVGKLFVTTAADGSALGALYEYEIEDEMKEEYIWAN